MDASLAIRASTSGDYRAQQSVTRAMAETTIPFLVNSDDTRSEIGAEILETEPQVGAGHVPHPIFSGRLFSLKNNKKKRMAGSGTTGNWGGRMFDYEQKYEEDEWGAEMGPESRFPKMYVDETEVYDLERVDSWRDVLDVLLVFIGLFSAIVTTFVIQTSQALQPDYGQLTATLVYNLILIQRTLANGALDSIPFPENPANPAIRPSRMEKWVNGLWFTSLAISLSTALVTVLTKQWLYHYMSQTSGTSRDRARLRQFRFAGLEKYHVPMIIDLLPVALHLALALFLVGLALFLYSLNRGISAIVIVISGIAYISYMVSAVLPLYDPQCPYQSPISSYLHHLAVHTPRVKHLVEGVILQAIFKSVAPFQRPPPQTPQMPGFPHAFDSDHSDIPSPGSWMDKLQKRINHVKNLLSSTPMSLQLEEREAVLVHCHQLDIDAITWLFSTSSNSTVRKISFMASVGLMPSAADTSQLRKIIEPYRSYSSGLRIEGLEYAHIQIIAACIDGFQIPPLVHQLNDVPIDEDDGYRIFSSLIFSSHHWSDSPLMIADFLAPGPRAHLRLPLSVWRVCINDLGEQALHPMMVMRLLQNTRPKQEHPGCHSPATFTDVIASDPLQSLMLDLLAKKLEIKRDSVSSFTSIPLLEAIMMWAVPYLETSESDDYFMWGENSYETAMPLLLDCLAAYRGTRSLHRPTNDMNGLQYICIQILSHTLVSPAIQWKAYHESANLLSLLWRYHPGLPCPPELLSVLLSYYTTTALRPNGPPVRNPIQEYGTVHVIPQMIACSNGDARVSHYNMLCEHDILPITLTRSGSDKSHLSQFWTVHMCHVAVFSHQNATSFSSRHALRHGVDTTAEWAQNWICYIDTPERLSFIFKRLVRGGDVSLSERVSPLLAFAATSPNWSAIFPSLIALLEDDTFIISIEHCENPRHQLSVVLLHMQKPTTLTSVDLSMYVIPLYGKKDTKILPGAAMSDTDSYESILSSTSDSSDDSSEFPPAPDQLDPSLSTGSIVEPSPIPEPSLIPDPLDPDPEQLTNEHIATHSSSNKTVSRLWNSIKAIVRFAKPMVPPPEQTPREMEEAGA